LRSGHDGAPSEPALAKRGAVSSDGEVTRDTVAVAAPITTPVADEAAGNTDSANQSPVNQRFANQSFANQSFANINGQDESALVDPVAPALSLAPVLPIPPMSPPTQDEPFGLAAASLSFGDVVTKWNGVQAEIRAERDVLAGCRAAAETCTQPARNFLAIVAQGRALTGRARIGVINRAVNLAVIATSDLAQWGEEDRWSAPLVTFATGRGDCEDYAIAKYVALSEAGIAPADRRLVIIRDMALGQDHAVAAVRLDGEWLMLDNRRTTLVADHDYWDAMPLFVLDDAGVRQFAPVALSSLKRPATPGAL
jgi:predicted transglutaminase-like cysteine proteinase